MGEESRRDAVAVEGVGDLEYLRAPGPMWTYAAWPAMRSSSPAGLRDNGPFGSE